MLGLWCLLVPLAGVILVGLPVRLLLAPGRRLDERAWTQVPFVGLAVVVLFLENLLLCDVPVRTGTAVLLAAVVPMWAVVLWLGRWRESLRELPSGVFAVALGVLLLQGVGVLWAGPEAFSGRGWSDQVNYDCMASYFREEGFTVPDDARLANHPYRTLVSKFEGIRVGQSVFQAYNGLLARRDCKDVFLTTCLLSCALLTLAVYASARAMGLGRMAACASGLLAGLLPAATESNLECFLSQVLATPLLLALPAVLARYQSRRSSEDWAVAALVFAGLVAVYTEFAPLALALLAGFFVLACAERRMSLRFAAGWLGIVVAPLVFNPLYVPTTLNLDRCILDAAVLHHIYPWAYRRMGQAVIWYGDLFVLRLPPRLLPVVGTAGLLTSLAGLAGLLAASVANILRWRRGLAESRACYTLPLSLAGLALVPLVVFLKDRDHSYQLFKLLISTAPVLALGVVTLAALVARLVPGRAFLRSVAVAAVWAPVGLVTVAAAAGSLNLQRCALDPTVTPSPENRYACQAITLAPSMRDLVAGLAPLAGRSLLYRPQGTAIFLQNSWIAYLARRNRVWTANPVYHDGVIFGREERTADMIDLNRLPDDYLVLSPRPSLFLRPPDDLPAEAVLWSTPSFQLWKPGDARWVGVVDVGDPWSLEPAGESVALWMTGEVVVKLLASEAGVAELDVVLATGPSVDPAEPVRMLFEDERGGRHTIEGPAGPVRVVVPVVKGLNRVRVVPLNRGRGPASPADPRVLLARLTVRGARPVAGR